LRSWAKESLKYVEAAQLVNLESAILEFNETLPDEGESRYVRRTHDALGLKSLNGKVTMSSKQ
jgi:hypothetical protein